MLKWHFPTQWKVAQIILRPRSGNPPPRANVLSRNEPLSYHIQSSRKASLKKTPPNSGKNQLTPNHQFGFIQRHYTIEQTHGIVQQINEALELYCCFSAFLDITQAFDKVWHTGVLCKLKLSLPLNYFLILKSYLQNRHSH
jgi:hypothetical protein